VLPQKPKANQVNASHIKAAMSALVRMVGISRLSFAAFSGLESETGDSALVSVT
jgi:hypothetical protein